MVLVASPASAQSRVSVIRDAEIEQLLRRIADPIFRVAGLHPDAVDVYLVQDDKLNAFVAGGQNLFLNTGLLRRAETPEQVAGVIAHETGHIAGGHLGRVYQARDRATAELIAGALLGLAAAVAGAPQVGGALFAGGATVAEQGMLSFSRSQEAFADQAALTYMTEIGLPPDGLLEFFEVMETSSYRLDSSGNVFSRTHPLTRDRMASLEAKAEQSPLKGQRLPADIQEAFERSRAKLDAFLGDPQRTVASYAGEGIVDRYARAIAYYKIPDLQKSLQTIDGLIAEEPANPFFHELKGQVLFENGRTEEAIAPYREAVRLMPSAAQIRFGLARALLEKADPQRAAEAAEQFRAVTDREPLNAQAWRFLGIAEGRAGDEAAASLALAEAAVLRRDREEAELFLARAEAGISAGDPSWVRLQDLRRAAADIRDRSRN
jgi:predicted Zn-dependent protease